jgi:hypothetical protein
MYRKRLIVIVTVLLLAPLGVAAQGSEASATGRATADAATPQARIQATLETALEAGIPRELLESKIEEGQAKGVAMERIAAAVEARLQGLLKAQEAFSRAGVEAVTGGELLVASEALNAGVSESALAAVALEAPRERRAVATAVLTDLVRLGYASGEAMARLDAALARGPEALVNLRAEAAASLRARGLISTEVGAGAGMGAGAGGPQF